MSNELFLTGNEDDQSHSIRCKIEHNLNKYEFLKTITLNYDPDLDYDIYEECYIFPKYTFHVGNRIPKIHNEIDFDFVLNYPCSLQNPLWYQLSKDQNIAWEFIEPFDELKTFGTLEYSKSLSRTLYDIYVQKYDRIILTGNNYFHVFF